MEYRNNLVGVPVKGYDVNQLIGEINEQLARPCLYTLLFMGIPPYSTQSLAAYNHYLPIPMPLKKAPRITVEVSSVGAKPTDVNSTIQDSSNAQHIPVCYEISPFVTISKTTGSVMVVPVAVNTSDKYCNYDLNRSIPIATGAIVTMKLDVDPDLFNEHTGNYLQDYALWFNIALVAPGTNLMPVLDNYKAAPTAITKFYAPWFTLNVIVDYEEDL